jgi:ribosomal peptide maturation radical SAM protein 1
VVDVCFVNMPYYGVERPSIGLGLLKAILQGQGITSEIIYANLWFAEEVGVVRYSIPDTWTSVEHFAGEWSFAEVAFRHDQDESTKKYCQGLEELLAGTLPRGFDSADVRQLILSGLLDLRRAAGPFIERTANAVLGRRPRVVGCTSMFQQHCASLALLRRIRELDPSVTTILGGPNCEAEMGATTHRNCEWVDYVVSGEADALVTPLCRMILEQGPEIPPEALPGGVLAPLHRQRADAGTVDAKTGMTRNIVNALDELPAPDYDDYFAALSTSSLRDVIHPVVLIESSRGCWWGEKAHCTFCGLNANGMTFRSKSADRVLSDLDYLTSRHGVRRVEAVDNILNMKYFDSLLAALGSQEKGWRIFYETKSNLHRGHVEALRRAGVNMIQPGIENLHSEVLRLMRKGVQAWANVRLLKWASQTGVRVLWSVLRGFPGELDQWYGETAAWVPLIHHFDPPSGVFAVRYDRFSPFHTSSAEFGLSLKPARLIEYVYPFSSSDLSKQSYYFDDIQRSQELAKGPGAVAMEQAVCDWREAFISSDRPSLWYASRGDFLEFHDTRGCAPSNETAIEGLHRDVYLCCEDGTARNRLTQLLKARYAFAGTEDEIHDAVESLIESKLILALDDRLLGLATQGPAPEFSELEDLPLGYVDPDYYNQELTRVTSEAAV